MEEYDIDALWAEALESAGESPPQEMDSSSATCGMSQRQDQCPVLQSDGSWWASVEDEIDSLLEDLAAETEAMTTPPGAPGAQEKMAQEWADLLAGEAAPPPPPKTALRDSWMEALNEFNSQEQSQ